MKKVTLNDKQFVKQVIQDDGHEVLLVIANKVAEIRNEFSPETIVHGEEIHGIDMTTIKKWLKSTAKTFPKKVSHCTKNTLEIFITMHNKLDELDSSDK